ncbi:MAG: shikimate dehydrogenase [Buchnera aphidicola (Chaetogeoica yunlongensis)]
MVELFKDDFYVFGNPIYHTKSPYIHKLFSIQTGISYKYSSKLVPLNEFKNYMIDFFLNNGKGANITVPFKEEAYFFSHVLTDRAKMSGSVNTFKKLKNNLILGDNTDGIGIFYDLRRINFITKIRNNVLLIGAGGAARGIIFTLLSFGCNIVIVNRTISKVKCLLECFKNKIGSISIFNDDLRLNYHFDLIINATVNLYFNPDLDRIKCFINKDICCYDINYLKKNKNTSFILWCLENGAVRISNGIGMLVSQAAYSFYLWYGFLPNIDEVINILVK